jgi:hypothetical protein
MTPSIQRFMATMTQTIPANTNIATPYCHITTQIYHHYYPHHVNHSEAKPAFNTKRPMAYILV